MDVTATIGLALALAVISITRKDILLEHNVTSVR